MIVGHDEIAEILVQLRFAVVVHGNDTAVFVFFLPFHEESLELELAAQAMLLRFHTSLISELRVTKWFELFVSTTRRLAENISDECP